MQIYLVNGVKRRYPEGEAPEGAVLVTKQKKVIIKEEPAKVEPVEEVKPKRRRTSNKSKKVEADK